MEYRDLGAMYMRLGTTVLVYMLANFPVESKILEMEEYRSCNQQAVSPAETPPSMQVLRLCCSIP